MLRASGGIWVGFFVVACNHASKPTASGSGDRADPSRGGDTAADSRLAIDTDAAIPPAGPRFRKEETCARDFSASSVAVDDLARLERSCARGMAPVLDPPASASPSPAGIVEVPFPVGVAACFRVAAVAPAGGLSLSVLDPGGALLIATASSEPLAVVPVDGTVCVRDLGTYRAVVRLATLDGATVSVQIWQASRD